MKAICRENVLDDGFVELLDIMGSDDSIDAAARVSFVGVGDEERTPEQRRGLIRMLMRHSHTSPFEMAELQFRVRMPIFVARQWIRHRTANVNEISGRYAALPDSCYVPKDSRIAKQSASNKQGSGESFGYFEAGRIADKMRHEQLDSRAAYEARIDDGVALELARINLPVSQYTEMVWKIDLHNLLHFLRLRLDAHAQYEIRVYGEAMASMVKERFPIAWEAFEDFRLNSVTLTAQDVSAIRSILAGHEYDSEVFKTGRERDEFEDKLKRLRGAA